MVINLTVEGKVEGKEVTGVGLSVDASYFSYIGTYQL